MVNLATVQFTDPAPLEMRITQSEHRGVRVVGPCVNGSVDLAVHLFWIF